LLSDDPRGGVRDPPVSYDGKKVSCSATGPAAPTTTTCTSSNADGHHALKQLTDGPFDDIEAAYLPDGGIVFVSSRCKRWVNCWLTQVAVLHRCDATAQRPRALQQQRTRQHPVAAARRTPPLHALGIRGPQPGHFHHLWATNPDGTAQMTWFGNLHPGITMIDARSPSPARTRSWPVFSPGHGQREHDGVVTVVDPAAAPTRRPSRGASARAPTSATPGRSTKSCFLAATATASC
jgi:hypothetical protein